jgi:hypothetical protein
MRTPRQLVRVHCGSLAHATARVSDTTIVRGGQVRYVEVSDTSSTGRQHLNVSVYSATLAQTSRPSRRPTGQVSVTRMADGATLSKGPRRRRVNWIGARAIAA